MPTNEYDRIITESIEDEKYRRQADDDRLRKMRMADVNSTATRDKRMERIDKLYDSLRYEDYDEADRYLGMMKDDPDYQNEMRGYLDSLKSSQQYDKYRPEPGYVNRSKEPDPEWRDPSRDSLGEVIAVTDPRVALFNFIRKQFGGQ